MTQDSKRKSNNKWRNVPELSQLYFDIALEDRERFKKICKARMRTMSSVIRDIIREFINRHESNPKRSERGSKQNQK